MVVQMIGATMFKYQKVGGLRFLRIGRVQFSFCIVKSQAQQDSERYQQYLNSAQASDLIEWYITLAEWKKRGKPNTADEAPGERVSDLAHSWPVLREAGYEEVEGDGAMIYRALDEARMA
jgi:hypothetical protein